MKKYGMRTAIAGLSVVAGVAAAAPSMAGGETIFSNYKKVVNISGITAGSEGPTIGSCTNPNGTCTISRSTGVSSQISTDFGMSASSVSSKIGFTYGKSTTETVGCTSPTLRSGQTFIAYVARNSRTYRIQDIDVQTWGTIRTETVKSTSGVLRAWEPYGYTSVHCKVK